MGDEPFDDFLPLSAKRTAPGEYDILDRDGRRLWCMEGAALAEWVCSVLNSRAILKAAEEYVEAVNRYEAEAKADESGQLVCGTGMLVADRLAKLRKAVDDLRRAREKEGEG